MESTGLSISVIVKMVEVGKEERGTKSKLTLLLPSHHSSARKIVSGKVAGLTVMKSVFGTIPLIPIPTPLANFGIELTLHSNSTLGIEVATPIPTQQNWGDSTGIPISKFPTFCSPLKRRKS